MDSDDEEFNEAEENPLEDEEILENEEPDERDEDSEEDPSDMGESDIDDELALEANAASSIKSLKEKKELLRFKRSHSEVEWEETLLKRSEQFGRKTDFERLKLMTKSKEVETKSTKKTPAKAFESKGKGAKGKGKKVSLPESDSDERKSLDSSNNNEDDDFDDLFDDDELAKYSSKKFIAKEATTTSTKSSGKAASKKVLSDGEEEEEEEEKEEDEMADEESKDDLSKDSDDEIINKRRGKAKAKRIDEEEEGLIDEDQMLESDDEDKPVSRKQRSRLRSKKNETPKTKISTPKATKSPKKLDRSILDNESSEEDESDVEDMNMSSMRTKRSNKRKQRQDTSLSDDEDTGMTRKKSMKGSNTPSNTPFKSSVTPLEEDDISEDASLSDYHSIQLRRHIIVKWLHEPFLKDAVEGAFVRVSIGYNRNKNEAEYRMAEVKCIEEKGNMYQLKILPQKVGLGGTRNARLEVTNMYLILSIGRKDHTVKITDISDQGITPKEFAIYGMAVKDPETGAKFLTKKQVQNRKSKIVAATKHVYTSEEISVMVARKQGMNKAIATEYHHAMVSLKNNRERAITSGEFHKLAEIDRTIKNLEKEIEEQKKLFNEAFSKYTDLNRRNKDENVKKDLLASKKKREEEQKGEVATAAKNPYLRRETRPTNLWNTGSKLLAVKAELDNKAESSTSATAAATSTTASNTANALTGNIVMTSDVMENTEEERDINVDIRELLASQQERQYRICGVAIDEARARIIQRHGVDPVATATQSIRDRYLAKVCANLPPKGSKEREELRNGYSFQIYLQQSRNVES